MLDKPLTSQQTTAILLMFLFGSSAVIGVSNNIAQDSWISLLLAFVFAVPILLVYARIMRLNPKIDLFAAFGYNFGKIAGKIAAALMAWYALHLCGMVMRNFSEFIQISALLDTPQLPVLGIMLVTVCYLARCGCKALGKWAVVTAPIVLGIVGITVLLSINILKYHNILPVMEHSVGEVARDAFQIFSFPFAETVLLLGIADAIDTHEKPAGIYLRAAGFGTGILLLITLRNLLVLGPSVMSISFFPSYMAARIISLGDFLSRIEGSISINFMLAGITKITLCLIFASRGIAYLFDFNDWRNLVLPTGVLAMMLSVILYQDTMEMYAFIRYYPYYAALFQIVLPVALWITSEVRARRKKPAEQAAQPA